MLTVAVAGVVDHPCIKHSYASTTALYTSVSSDFRTRTLRGILDGTVARALASRTTKDS